jgi:hypothetical protein
MRLLASFAVATLALTLSGCMTAEDQRAADEAKCRSYGFQQRNDAFAECLQRLELDRRADLREMRRDPFFEPMVIYRPVIVRPPAK